MIDSMKSNQKEPGRLNLNDPKDGLIATRKIFSSTIDGEETIYTWQGKAYSHIDGEHDRHLFNITGMNIRTTATHEDADKGIGFRMFSREVMLFLDPATNQILKQWKNPWSGELVKVFHVANDPANSRPIYPSKLGFEGKVCHGKVLLSYQIPLFYANPLLDIKGGNKMQNYHALEMFDFFLSENDLTDQTSPRVSNIFIAWNRIAQWEPWMQMGDQRGELIFDAAGMRVNEFSELSTTLRNEIQKNYPNFQAPPPLNDPRPNRTSWSNYKDWLISNQTQTKDPRRELTKNWQDFSKPSF